MEESTDHSKWSLDRFGLVAGSGRLMKARDDVVLGLGGEHEVDEVGVVEDDGRHDLI